MTSTQRMIVGNCADVLKTIPDRSVDCCVTSPPYYLLRDYGTEPLLWGGDPLCPHEWTDQGFKTVASRRDHDGRDFGETRGTEAARASTSGRLHKGSLCPKCGAWRGQLGLETTPDLYVQHLVRIFDEVKRVLKPSGTCWVIIGETYEDKAMLQIPARFSIAMSEHGWKLRNRLIWEKPNAMPSSISDRFTIDYEDVQFFALSGDHYFLPQKEPMKRASKERYAYAFGGSKNRDMKDGANHTYWVGMREATDERNMRSVWSIPTKGYRGNHYAAFPLALVERTISAGCPPGGTVLDPFAGSGTVLEYCRMQDLNAIGIELNPVYKKLADDRAMLTIPQIDAFAQEVRSP